VENVNMKQYSWALNKNKLARAIGKVGEGDEEAVKKEYINIGGLVVEGTPSTIEVDPDSISSSEDAGEVETKPKRKKKDAE
jgi:hypothetical protein